MYFLVILLFALKYKPSLYKFLEAGSLLFGKLDVNFQIVSLFDTSLPGFIPNATSMFSFLLLQIEQQNSNICRKEIYRIS